MNLTDFIGRFTREEMTRFGRSCPSVAYLQLGPAIIFFNLPKRFRKADVVPEVVNTDRFFGEGVS